MKPPVPTRSSQVREQQLVHALRRAARLETNGRRISARFTTVRLAIFACGLFGAVIPHKLGWTVFGNLVLAASFVFFLIVAWYHNRLEDRLHRLRRWQGIKRVHLARLSLKWTEIPLRPMTVPERHAYARDLDLAGPRSLLHLIDHTISSQGQQRLASWLLEQPPHATHWSNRQALIRELTPLSLLRDRLVLEAQAVEEADIDGRRLLSVLQKRVDDSGLMPMLLAESVLALTTAALLLADVISGLGNYWMLSFGIYAILFLSVRSRSEEIFDHAQSLHLQLERLSAVLGYLERRSYRATPHLANLCSPLRQQHSRPSRSLKQAASLMNRLSVRAHPLVHYLINAIGPWDLFHTYRLQQLQDRIASVAPLWFELLAELDAAASLATFAHLHPAYLWPTLHAAGADGQGNGEAPGLAAEGLAHPLIPTGVRVANDVTFAGRGRIFLVTGSNMSGKSTFLRTIGINTCLAQAGAPVCATAFHWSLVRIGSCIRVDDSLDGGLSFFYAEVKRLKTILDSTRDEQGPPVLWLIDEVFKGTNNRERLIGGRALITALAGGNGFGLVTTHDLELAELERQLSSLTNVHFQETVVDGALHFDYRLKPGPCPTTNALRIMALEGLPIETANPTPPR
ncbi:MAG: MutS-related protein, family 1 [Nitrospira sp.]|nr:MAG: MutS-related protein, family 1 [Nitrospira sp.]